MGLSLPSNENNESLPIITPIIILLPYESADKSELNIYGSFFFTWTTVIIILLMHEKEINSFEDADKRRATSTWHQASKQGEIYTCFKV